jgi:drug/metabolite transporter (DMT)-like permease
MIFSWLFIIILAYLFFSLSYLGDKLILSGPPKPNSYTFFVGAISIFVVIFIPFINFGIPDAKAFFWIIAEAIVYILGLYVMFVALERFDVSRVMTTIGAAQPIFIFALTWLFWGAQPMTKMSIFAFVLLVLGGILISFERNSKTNGDYLKITIFAALLFSLDYIFSKIVFLNQPFLQGFIWMRIFVFLFSLLFLISRNTRKEIFKKQNILNKKTGAIFIGTHLSGGAANILQSLAIYLAPVVFLPIVSSLRGIQYVFLFLMTLFLSVLFPKILKEEISEQIIAQKVIAIVLIVLGLAILVF